MKKVSVVAALLLLLGLTVVAEPFKEKEKPTGRLLTGRVVDRQDGPLPSSVVYLTNTRTRAVKTYIVGNDGEYRFPALSLNIDYEVYAQFNGRKSDTKTVSQFDSRPVVNINLRIDAK
jgi:Carboxypeptidase regulatory-like domain